MPESLYTYIKSFTDLSDESWNIFQPALQEIDLCDGAFLLKEGQTCNFIFFINSGYCRTYYNQYGKDINSGFFFEKDFVTNMHSLGTGEKSRYNIQACETLSVVRLDRSKIFKSLLLYFITS
jgi:CRP-like cAMP-binding protein